MTAVPNWPYDWLCPEWPAHPRVRACVTTASMGESLTPYASFNLGEHVGEAPQTVHKNREFLAAALGCTPVWLEQRHGVAVVEAMPGITQQVDASFSCKSGIACAIMTADCLPVLLADRQGEGVAAAHAGWRSLAAGILEATVAAMPIPAHRLMAWFGPAIGPYVYEVGFEVREAFVSRHNTAVDAFVPSQRVGHWFADLYQLARIRLAACGVEDVYGGGFCTFSDARFYSYRRTPVTGRFASLIWLT